ncbi:MAG: hypothetical protein GWN01_16900 [Nitrosopumilaceae archaeon]|nr:hypothetical protein [Nitrosopumilaceae archaeon]NIU02510.1 hypothetical protein [Nitrosopumilaceae archaeon]NIU88971.1 hypothetical protein [Nitrosopumilaceae archaeon]NIV67082.1 hypothetical protein [Nitrosopumilaceae archaeon]NIX63111.1 hypothetical protein [Nitrosopumilaceae archaeon]
MVRVFYAQKTQQLLNKIELSRWRQLLQDQITKTCQDLSDDWAKCAIGERIKLEGKTLKSIKDLSPEAKKLGYEFSVALQEHDSEHAVEIITQIEHLPTIWNE